MDSRARFASLVGAVGAVCIANAATITIDPAQTYQTIEGFGAFAQCSDYGKQAYTDFLHNDLGVTALRMQVPHDFEPSNENGDAGSLELAKFNLDGGVGRWYTVVNGMKRFSDVKFIASIWTPPGWMKDMTRDHWSTQYSRCSDGQDACGGHLKESMREELAEYCLAYYKAIEQRCGVKLYGISLQNESAFIEWYVSCVYTPDEYAATLKAVGARFEREGVDIKLFGAEDMVDALTAPGRNYVGAINRDAEAREYLDAVAVHGYTDGVHPFESSSGASAWKKLGLVGYTTMHKSTWMSETSGFSQDWSGAWNLASNIYMALRYGKVSLWTFWADNEASEYGLVANGQHTERSAASKNFYRWMRPGAAVIGSASDDEHVFVVAAHHGEDKTLTIVLLNDGAATTVSLSGSDLPDQLQKHTTTSAKKCVSEGMVSSSGSIALDANSVTTLYGENYSPSLVARAGNQTARPVAGPPASVVRAYGLDGRRLHATGRGQCSRLWVEGGAAGSAWCRPRVHFAY